MRMLKKINKARSIVINRLLKIMGISDLRSPTGPIEKAEIKRVLISRPNHRLGNLLLLTPLLQEVSEAFPEAKIDLFVKGNIAPIIFKNYGNIQRIIQLPRKPMKKFISYLRGWIKITHNPYDLVINVVNHSASGKVAARLANGKYKFAGDTDEGIRQDYPDHEHMAKYPVYSFRTFLKQLGFTNAKKEAPPLDLKLSPSEIAEGKRIVGDLVKNDKKTIALFTYATGDKLYTPAWWGQFYERLKKEFPEYNMIEILPIENVSQISFKAPSFYSKDIREIGSVMRNTEIFIGADSGMMHLASAAKVPTVGLFKAMNINTYAPYGNKSLGINTVNSNVEDWIGIIKNMLG